LALTVCSTCWIALSAGYPPFNIIKTGETSYRIEVAVAGFGPQDLLIRGARECGDRFWQQENTSEQQLYLHHVIASRAFERPVQPGDYVKVAGADLVNGLLTIELLREIPEAMRPRKLAGRPPGSAGRLARQQFPCPMLPLWPTSMS
jgi:molecular chaperone IbpA